MGQLYCDGLLTYSLKIRGMNTMVPSAPCANYLDILDIHQVKNNTYEPNEP